MGILEAEWQWWNYVGVSLGLFGMCLSAYPMWRRLSRAVTENGATVDVGDIVKPILALLFLGGALALSGYLVFVYESPKWEWVHPTLSAAEQERTKAECEMAAYDAIGGGGDGIAIGSTKGTDRLRYVSACLTAKGFKHEQVGGE